MMCLGNEKANGVWLNKYGTNETVSVETRYDVYFTSQLIVIREEREQWIRQKYTITPSNDETAPDRLHQAAAAGDVVAVLREHANGTDLNAQSENQRGTALHAAVMGEHTPCVLLLLLNGANPNSTDLEGNTALHIAARNGHLPSLRVLIRYRAEDVRNNAGYTATELAINGQHEQCVQLLQSLDRRESFNTPKKSD